MNEEVVPNRVVPVSAGGDRAAVHLWGDPQITGSSPVEVERGGDAEPGEWLGCEGGSQFGKGGFAGKAESPVMPTVPYEEGTGTSVAIAQTGHRDVILDEEGAGLYEMAGGGEGAPVPPAEKTRGSFHRKNSGSEGGTCIPGSDTSAVLDYQSERVAFRGEESGVDGIIIVDVPSEEQAELLDPLSGTDIDLIKLVISRGIFQTIEAGLSFPHAIDHHVQAIECVK